MGRCGTREQAKGAPCSESELLPPSLLLEGEAEGPHQMKTSLILEPRNVQHVIETFKNVEEFIRVGYLFIYLFKTKEKKMGFMSYY